MLRFTLFITLFFTATAGADERPNLIIFIADDMAWNDCRAYGHPKIRTPNIDRLAKDGMRFDAAFLTCSSCSPSRCSIITGRYPHSTGARQLHQPLLGTQVTFVEKLTTAGYHTTAAGKWHLGQPTRKKFSKIYPRVGDMVKAVKERPKDKPFFGWFAFIDPHRPYGKKTIPKPHARDDVRVPPFFPDTPAVRDDLALYYDEIARLDGVIGQVLDALEKQSATRNTLVLFISDNGRPFPRCKTTILDSGIKTPFIIKWPAKVKAGTTCSSLVSTVDIAPTFLALAGLESPKSFQGVSFAPLLADTKAKVREYIFAEHNWHDFDDHQRGVRDSRFKYIRNSYRDIPLTPPADAVRSPTFQQMIQLHKEGKLNPKQTQCFLKPRAAEELYDLKTDPYELHNLADDRKYREHRDRLRKTLDAWQKKTGDWVPKQRRRDEFDRVTGKRVAPKRK